MAEKKKSPSTARPRAKKTADAAAPVAATLSATPVAAAAPVAPMAPSSLPGLEVDARPMIQMPAPPPVVTHDAIARRAHEIHHARGGSAFDNWLQAERELAGR